MFRSTRRDVVYPQAEHARLAATIALAWGNETFPPPPIPREAFVAGVALHDRGYDALDADGIGEVPPERWLQIQREGFRPRSDDALVDLIVAMHVHRLVRNSRSADAGAELERMLPELRRSAGISETDASAVDRLTDICDRIAFDFCFEEEAEGGLAIQVDAAGSPIEVRYRIDGRGGVTIDPWPLDAPRVHGVLVAFRAGRYPAVLEPVVVPYELRPAA